MPRTVEHIVETHQIARERRKAGRQVWDETLYMTEAFELAEEDPAASRDAIVAVVKASRWWKLTAPADEYDDPSELYQLIEEMEDWGKDDSEDYFRNLVDALYDLADTGDHRVWIDTFGGKP